MNQRIHIVLFAILSASCYGEGDGKNTIYSPFGKRDPFRPPAARSGREVSSINPLERYSVEQFRLKAVVQSPARPHAMFVDPVGTPYVLTEGDMIGKEKAVVSRILASEVILTQKTTNYLGLESLVEKIVSLPEEESILSATSAAKKPTSDDNRNPNSTEGVSEFGSPKAYPQDGTPAQVGSLPQGNSPTPSGAATPPSSSAATPPSSSATPSPNSAPPPSPAVVPGGYVTGAPMGASTLPSGGSSGGRP